MGVNAIEKQRFGQPLRRITGPSDWPYVDGRIYGESQSSGLTEFPIFSDVSRGTLHPFKNMPSRLK